MSTQSSKWLFWLAIGTIFALWSVAAGLRHWSDSSVHTALEENLWAVKISGELDNTHAGMVVRVAIPGDTLHVSVVGQNLIHPGWQLRFRSDPEWRAGRQVRLEARKTGAKRFELGFILRQSATPLILRPANKQKLSSAERERYLSGDAQHETITKAVSAMATKSQSNQDLLSHIFERSHQLLPTQVVASRTVSQVLESGRARPLERARLMVALCRTANIPARLVTGLVLKEELDADLHHWVEVNSDSRQWEAYDPLLGYQQTVPHNFVPFIKDRADLVEADPTTKIHVAYAVLNADEFPNMGMLNNSGWQSVFFLARLPLEVRNVLAHLMLLPLAVLLTTLFREFTGIRSYGTFMPALFALAMVYAQWSLAGITLGIVLLFGVLGRSALPGQLRRQPRLTAVLVLVILSVSASVSLIDYLGLQHDGAVILLPVVIMAILVDLFYRTLEKEGPASAFTRLFWTLVQVVLCLPVTQYISLGHWLVAHPETHLLTLIVVLLISTYQGRRLADNPRFHWLNSPPRLMHQNTDPMLKPAQTKPGNGIDH